MAKVSVSTKLAAPADEVWSLIGGWNTVPDWHPAVEKSETEQGGQFRRLQFTDGAEITERLKKFDRDGRTYTYSITASPLPFTDYRSTIGPDEVAVEALDLHLTVPAGAHDLGEPFGIIGIRLVEPQRQGRLDMARIQADYRQTQRFERVPVPGR